MFMKPWVFYGLSNRLTERFKKKDDKVKGLSPVFRNSLHIFPIDVGNDNELNFEIEALQSAQYNIHRFGIFFTDSPRHADVLLVLGKCTEKMVAPLKETINQLSEPYGIVVVEGDQPFGLKPKELDLDNVLAYYERYLSADEILSVLLNIMEVK